MRFTGVNENPHRQRRRRRGGCVRAHRFVGPVVLFEDLLRAILAAICKHHYHLIAVGPRGAGLLRGEGGDGGQEETGTGGDGLGNVRVTLPHVLSTFIALLLLLRLEKGTSFLEQTIVESLFLAFHPPDAPRGAPQRPHDFNKGKTFCWNYML